ncbi:MAG: RNA pseudouridine synthase [Rhodobacteraceae bacterium]|nr:RNA pseudouridine synthase [Paracoccaceae bacterium]MBR28041.1 RNA pseudouridine synthase [Paracoccaceae bacterium]
MDLFAPLSLPPLRDRPYAPPPGPLAVIHADAALLVVEKPSGLLTVPGKDPALADCLAARAEAAFPGARIVHRIDMDTSGLVVLARSPEAQRHLGLQFERRIVEKAYVARVRGAPAAEAGRIEAPLMTDWPARPRQKVDPQGRPAVTDWTREAVEPCGDARLSLRPLTGRSHQLRVHLAALGHPILGDALYGDDAVYGAAPRLQLHAERLRLRHPQGGAWMAFHAPAPF